MTEGVWRLEELVAIARERSPFFRELYASVPERGFRLEDLPLAPHGAYWSANGLRDNRVLTGPIREGVVFRSGGTTGAPKFSVFSRSEWEVFCRAFGHGMAAGGLAEGARVANLFYAGDLYASFLFILKSVENSGVPVLHLPIAGATPVATIAQTLGDFEADTVAGVPTTILALAEFLAASGRALPSVRRVLFGGESMYPDQRARVAEVFPGARVQSIGYASVDGGLLGYADPSCGPDEHRAFGTHTVLEIVDSDTGETIRETGRPGRVILTSLTRALMPILRYPAGDLAEWTEPEGPRDRRFRLLGRSDEGARVGPTTLYYEDVVRVLEAFRDRLGAASAQIRVLHHDLKDGLVLRVATGDPDRGVALERELVQAILKARPMLEQMVHEGKVHPVRVEWVRPSELVVNARTGKLRRIIDERLSV